MGEPKNLRNRLDERYADILRAIWRKGGTASTTEIKHLTGIDTNQIITQRMDRLQEWDLVDTGHRERKGTNQLPTKVATLTARGNQVIEDGLLDGLGDEDRIRGVDELNDRLDTLERRLEGLEEDYDDLDDDLWGMMNTQNRIQRNMATTDDVDSLRETLHEELDSLEEEISSWQVTVEGIRRYLVNEACADLIPHYPDGK